ncbi:MAG: sugar ABC transporter ATP-binding protein [Acidothermus cellulolyticus]|nr:sugar ABC transporter ATP-binding protein [Acidothermus cellulolyticus]
MSKLFPGVQALQDVTFCVTAGEVCALVGENGAGKSTLLAILGGASSPSSGWVTIDGVRRAVYTPRQAREDGVIVAHQEPALVPQLSVRQNLLLGQPRAKRRSASVQIERALADMAGMGLPVEAKRLVGTLSPAERHALTVARAFMFDAKIVALDEPTVSMTESNVEGLLGEVRRIARERGVAVLYVSHKLAEVMAIADRVVVLRDGRVVSDMPIRNTTEKDIISMMVGRELLAFARQHTADPTAPPLFSLRRATHPSGVGPISLDVRSGEVVGIYGLVGSGRTELLRAIIHADPGSGAEVIVSGRKTKIHSPADARDAGIAFIPEDRRQQGLILNTPAYKNVSLTATSEFSRGPFTSRSKQVLNARSATAKMNLRPANVLLDAKQFSGGNQQKLVLAKWTWRDCKVFLFDEPTKGVDVGGKAEIYRIIDGLAAQGCAIVIVSSELPELLALCDRILVLRNGTVVASYAGTEITEKALVASAVGFGDSEQ